MRLNGKKNFNKVIQSEKMTKLREDNDLCCCCFLIWTPGGCLSLPLGYIYVYGHYFQTFSLKPLAKFYVEPPGKRGHKFIKMVLVYDLET